MLNTLSLSLRLILRRWVYTLIHIIVLLVILVSIINIYPLAGGVEGAFKSYSRITSSIIEVRPEANVYDSIYPVYSPLYNFTLSIAPQRKFNETTYNMIKGLEHVKDVIRELSFQNKPLESYFEENNISGYKAIMISAIEVNKTGDVIFYLNNLVEGRYIKPGEKEIVLTTGARSWLGLDVGDEVTFIFGPIVNAENTTSYEEIESLSKIKFKIVGIISVPSTAYVDAVADLGVMMKIFKETNADRLRPFIENGSFPVYTSFYVKVDDPKYLVDVGSKIQKMFPKAGVYYPAVQAKLIMEVLQGLKRNFDMMNLFILAPAGIILFSVRVLEGVRSRRQIGLLKAMGWTNKHILTLVVVDILFIGLVSGVLASLVSILIAPYLRGILISGGYFGTGLIRANIMSVLYNMMPRIPDERLMLLSPLIGIVLFILASLFTTIYYARLSPAETLKEV